MIKLVKKANAEEIAEEISDRVLSLVKKKPHCILGLATGSSPIPTYMAIAKKAKEEKISFKNVKSFNLDEYINSPDITQSYRYFMNTNLFDHIDIDKKNTNFPNEKLLDKYDKEIARAGGVDLQILGIGGDGHIGFNEPGTSFSSLHPYRFNLKERTIKDNARFFKSIDEVPTQAVTMGLATIMKSKSIILIATGKNKAEAIMKTFAKPSEDCPASILQNHPDVTIYCDEDAASLLK
jgi:glucosamine-6-phosphate deaminase